MSATLKTEKQLKDMVTAGGEMFDQLSIQKLLVELILEVRSLKDKEVSTVPLTNEQRFNLCVALNCTPAQLDEKLK